MPLSAASAAANSVTRAVAIQAGEDVVDPDAARGQLDGQVLRKARRRHARDGRQRGRRDELVHAGRRDVDDAPASAFRHVARSSPAQPDDAERDQLPRALPLLVAAIRGSSVWRAAHVGHEHVETTELRDRALDGALAVPGRRDVGRDREDACLRASGRSARRPPRARPERGRRSPPMRPRPPAAPRWRGPSPLLPPPISATLSASSSSIVDLTVRLSPSRLAPRRRGDHHRRPVDALWCSVIVGSPVVTAVYRQGRRAGGRSGRERDEEGADRKHRHRKTGARADHDAVHHRDHARRRKRELPRARLKPLVARQALGARLADHEQKGLELRGDADVEGACDQVAGDRREVEARATVALPRRWPRGRSGG